MHFIDRSVRFVAVAIASALLIACGSDGATAPRTGTPPADSIPTDTTPATTPSLVGTWTSRTIDGNALPARIAGGTDQGITWELRVVQDTLLLTADGHWVQRVRTRQTQSDGFIFASVWFDRGVWTRTGDTLHFESEWIQNVAFDAQVMQDGSLVVHHNFTLDDRLDGMLREMRR